MEYKEEKGNLFLSMSPEELNFSRSVQRKSYGELFKNYSGSELTILSLNELQSIKEKYEDGLIYFYNTYKTLKTEELKHGCDLLFLGLNQLIQLQNRLTEEINLKGKTENTQEEVSKKEFFLLEDETLIKLEGEPFSNEGLEEKTIKSTKSEIDEYSESFDCDEIDDCNSDYEEVIKYDFKSKCTEENPLKHEDNLPKSKEDKNASKFQYKTIKRDHACPLCPKVLKSAEFLRIHLELHNVTCPICKKEIKNKRTLKIHMRTHTGERPYKCDEDQCSAAFAQLSGLHKHKLIHSGEKPFVCDHCGKAFGRKKNLEYHINTHTGEKPFQCDLCHAKFGDYSGVRSHKQVHHSTVEEKIIFKCDQCFKEFSTKPALNRHMRIHTGEKPYQCKQCSKSFNDTSSLAYHVKVHNGERNYKCDQCTKTFIKQSRLRDHLRSNHTGEKPFKCEICEKDFAVNDRLKKHIKEKHNATLQAD